MYDVLVLVEEELNVPDAEELVQLYAGTQDPAKFHVLLPCGNAKRVHGQEVVVLTRPHIIAEMLHADWSAQA
jgi:hypothetical protein